MVSESGSTPRARSPRSPAFPLKDALDRAVRIYDKEGRHSIPGDVAAQDIGYKDAKSGAARTALATLRQFGLLIAPKEGHVAVSRPVETYKFAPDDATRASLLLEFLRTPPIYRTLLNKYQDRLPSDAALRFELVNMGFLAGSVEEDVQTFKKSVEFSRYYEQRPPAHAEFGGRVDDAGTKESDSVAVDVVPERRLLDELPASQSDRIPIRLSGGRKAILEIPAPFYEADKRVIKAQIELILTDDESEGVRPTVVAVPPET